MFRNAVARFWEWKQTEQVIFENRTIEEQEHELALDDLPRFRNLPQIRLHELRRNVETCLARDYTVTLQQVLDVFPPRHGMMEVIGYLVVAANEPRDFVGEEPEVIQLPPPQRQRWRVPRVLFCKG